MLKKIKQRFCNHRFEIECLFWRYESGNRYVTFRPICRKCGKEFVFWEHAEALKRLLQLDSGDGHDPNMCRYAQYDIRTENLHCMGTKEMDLCQGRKCSVWQAKEEA